MRLIKSKLGLAIDASEGTYIGDGSSVNCYSSIAHDYRILSSVCWGFSTFLSLFAIYVLCIHLFEIS